MPGKRTAQGAGSIRQRPDGRWEARITIGRDGGTGKQIQKSIYGSTQREVRQRLQQISVAIDNGEYAEPSKLSVAQWFDTWLEAYNGNVKPSTVITYEQQIRNHIKPALGAIKLKAITAAPIQKLYNDMLKSGLSPKMVKNCHGVVHKALEQAARLGYIRSNPSSLCTLPRIEKAEIAPLDTPDIETFLNAVKGHRYETLYIVDMFTGMREGEILGLTWDCVDFNNGIISIEKQLLRPRRKGDIYEYGTLKNGKTRAITPAPTVMQALRARKLEQNMQRLKAGTLWDEGTFPQLVFTNEFGGHLNYSVVYKDFKKLLERAGIAERRFHDLRHTYAVSSLRSGDDVKTVQENLGHHTAAFTLDQYGHVTETMKRESAERMEGFIASLSKGK